MLLVPTGEYPQLPLDTSQFSYQWYRGCSELLEDETNEVKRMWLAAACLIL